MNILEIQEELEYWPDQKIQEEIMRPTGAANGQTYLVVLESERRTNERQSYENEMAQQEHCSSLRLALDWVPSDFIKAWEAVNEHS